VAEIRGQAGPALTETDGSDPKKSRRKAGQEKQARCTYSSNPKYGLTLAPHDVQQKLKTILKLRAKVTLYPSSFET
jgi:hypothetical protein